MLALLVSSGNRLAKLLGLAIVEVGRGLPLLVLLYVVYQGLPQVKCHSRASRRP